MGKVRVAMVDVSGGNALYHYLNDRLGTPEILTDASGTVAWEAWHEPFGEAHIHPSSSVVNNIRFPGQYYDSETGFHYNYHRYHDPKSGRYITPDPIGLAGGINLYPYVDGNPVNSDDPLGLYESYWFLQWVPGQNLFDLGMTSLEDNSYGLAGLYFAGMVGEQVLWALTFGQSMAVQGGAACELNVASITPKNLPLPKVTDPKLKNLVDDLYKGARSPNRIGTGSTADAVRSELATGVPTHGYFHSQKAQQYSRALEKWMSRNPNASDHDKIVARKLLQDLQKALRGD